MVKCKIGIEIIKTGFRIAVEVLSGTGRGIYTRNAAEG
jgi:hypothetical protein